MEKANVYLFTSPTCPHCPSAKRFIHDFKSSRDDFVLTEYSIATNDGKRKAEKYDVYSVPTFIILGDGYPQPIGLSGTQTRDVMNKYIDLALGKKRLEDFERKKSGWGISIGRLKIKF